jgi:hypothetical protein
MAVRPDAALSGDLIERREFSVAPHVGAALFCARCIGLRRMREPDIAQSGGATLGSLSQLASPRNSNLPREKNYGW